MEGFTVVSPPMARKGMSNGGLKMMVGGSCERFFDGPKGL